MENWEHIVAVSAGYGYTLALTEDGDVLSAGNYADGQREVDNWNKVRAYTDEWALVFTEWNNW